MNVEYHLLKRKNKAGKTVYYVGFLSDMPGKNGKKRYSAVKSTGAGNKPLAHKIARQMIEEGTVFASRDNLKTYLLDFWDPKKSEYLRSRIAEESKTYSVMYLEGNIAAIKSHFLPYFEERHLSKLSDLTAANLTAWRNHLRLEKKASPRTVNRTRQAVWTALTYAVDIGLLPYHPGGRIKKIHEETPPRKIFELEELEKLFSAPWSDLRIYTGALFAAGTGARLGEVRGLRFRNLHLDLGYVDIVENYQDAEGLKICKWDSGRAGVPLPSRIIDALEKLMAIHRWGAQPDSFVFFDLNTPKLPIGKHALSEGLKIAVKNSGLPGGRTFHCLRHTFISHVSGNISPASLRYHVGHSNAETTALYEHQTERDTKALKDVQNKMLPYKAPKTTEPL
jgi:integrase